MTRGRGERGAALVEFAIVAILLLTIGFGVAEMGLGWQDRLTVQAAARSGARVGSSLTTDAAADYNVLLAIKAAIQDVGVSKVQYVVVYKSTAVGGAVPTACVSPNVVSVANVCNAYTGAQLVAMTSTQFGCGAGKLDNAWCPTARQNLLANGPDYLGVWIRVNHTRLTKLFGAANSTITDSAVMRLEPLT